MTDSAPIRIPTSEDESVTRIPTNSNSQAITASFMQDTNNTLQQHGNLIYLGLIIVSISLVAVVVGAIAIVVDQMHFNNELYREGGYNHTKTVISPSSTIQPAPLVQAPSNPLGPRN